jgi:hypothetical protein
LGTTPSILSIAQQPPLYQITYQASESNYSFYVLYDYLQNRIISGNITINKQTTAQQSSGSIQTGTTGFLTPAIKTTTSTGSANLQTSTTRASQAATIASSQAQTGQAPIITSS